MSTNEVADNVLNFHAKPRSNGNSHDILAKLRLCISDLTREVESLEVSYALSKAIENCESVRFYEEVSRFEIALIRTALELTQWHQDRAARLLNLHPSTLHRKMKRYAIGRLSSSK